jgi:quinol monooxygenase YgiN/mannose-6-phosphate isomerase-like protein (cupin superfamily)
MSRVARYAKVTARPGMGDALARELLAVADALRGVPGCELYVINRVANDPDVVWVTEQWQSQELLDAALAMDEARARMPHVHELVREGGFERIDLEPVGGVGLPAAMRGFAIVRLDELEDMAARFGFGAVGEARFARTALGASTVGVSVQRLRPGARQAFGHNHRRDEEIYVVLSGAGLVAVDEEVHEIAARDAIRVAPASLRAFEAGREGLELLAVGTHHPGDVEMRPGFWPR